MRRRTFLTGVATGTGGTLLSCARGGSGPRWRFFTAEEAATVDAICGQIIPADSDPGAREARVVNYIDLQLTRHFRKHQAAYRQGIAGVDRTSNHRFGKRFVTLSPEQQMEVLLDVEEHSKVFFDLILAHTRQGFYGDPRHGGNRNMASWEMLGLPFPPVRGRAHYDDPSKVG